VRHDAARVGRGITVAQLRARLKDPAYARWRAGELGRGAAGTTERAAFFSTQVEPGTGREAGSPAEGYHPEEGVGD